MKFTSNGTGEKYTCANAQFRRKPVDPSSAGRAGEKMRFARFAYGVAAVYGFLALTPLYFLVGKIGHDAPPPVTHPEFYYGFVGVTLLWQMVFVLIARDPIRYRSLMPITILEKLVYTVPVVVLYVEGQVHPRILPPALIDPVFGVLFVLAYFRTPRLASS